MLKMPRSRKPILPKPVFRTLVWTTILLAVAGGGGAAYVWYAGQNAKFVESANTETATKRNEPKPTKPQVGANVGVAVHALMSPVAPGDLTSITVRTTAGAKCTIKVEYNKIASKDQALTDQVADEYGIVTWDWHVDATAPEGKWPVEVNCSFGDKAGMVRGDLEVALPKT